MKYAKNENGTVKNYGDLKQLGNYKHYTTFWKALESVKNSEGFYEIQTPTPTKYQRVLGLIPSDLVGNKWVYRYYDMTQDEKDEVDQAELDMDTSAQKYSTRVNDGQVQYKRFVDKIIRDKDATTITPQEALQVIMNFNEGMQFLKDGFQEATKSTVNSLTPANQYETDLQTLIIDKLTEYINENPL